MKRKPRWRRDDDKSSDPAAAVVSPGVGISGIPSPGNAVDQALGRVQHVLGVVHRYQNLTNTAKPVVRPDRAETLVSAAMPGRRAVHHSQVDKFFGPTIGQGPTRALSNKALVVPPAPSPAAQAAKPSVKLDQAGAKALSSKGVNLKGDGGALCRSVNRPQSNAGDGSSRAFIPWCSKGKKG